MRLIINLALVAAVVLFALWQRVEAKQADYLPRLDRPSETNVAMVRPNRPMHRRSRARCDPVAGGRPERKSQDCGRDDNPARVREVERRHASS